MKELEGNRWKMSKRRLKKSLKQVTMSEIIFPLVKILLRQIFPKTYKFNFRTKFFLRFLEISKNVSLLLCQLLPLSQNKRPSVNFLQSFILRRLYSLFTSLLSCVAVLVFQEDLVLGCKTRTSQTFIFESSHV